MSRPRKADYAVIFSAHTTKQQYQSLEWPCTWPLPILSLL